MSESRRSQGLFSRLLARPAFRWLMVVYAAIALVAMGLSFVGSALDRLRFSDSDLQSVQEMHAELLSDLQNEAERTATGLSVVSSRLADLALAAEPANQAALADQVSLTKRLDELQTSFETLSETVRDVRSLIDPESQEELLTVLRLGDKFRFFEDELEELQGELTQIRQEVDDEMAQHYESTSALVEGARDTVRWMALLLVPPLFSALLVFLPRRARRDAEVEADNAPDTP